MITRRFETCERWEKAGVAEARFRKHGQPGSGRQQPALLTFYLVAEWPCLLHDIRVLAEDKEARK